MNISRTRNLYEKIRLKLQSPVLGRRRLPSRELNLLGLESLPTGGREDELPAAVVRKFLPEQLDYAQLVDEIVRKPTFIVQ